MNYHDEEIIEIKRGMQIEEIERMKQEKIEKEKAESIFDGMVHINGQEVAFERRKFEQFGFSILLPVDFVELDEEWKKEIFVYEQKPDLLLYGPELPFQIGINHTTNIVPNHGIDRLLDIASQTMDKIGPKCKILSKQVKTMENHKVGVLEMSAMALDGPIYCCQFFMSMKEERLLIGSLNCKREDYSRMYPVLQEIIDSILFDVEGKED